MLTNVPLALFYSYSHEDEELRNQLDNHLSMLKRQGVISGWHDRRIIPGENWGDEVDENLNSADLILLLTSSDFLASTYCYDIELARAMERHASGEAHVIPIILRPCDWHTAPFGKLQALPKNAKPLTLWANSDEAFLDIVKGIRSAVTAIQGRPARLSSPATDGNQRTHGRLIPDVLRVPFVNRKDREGNDILERLTAELRPDGQRFVALWGAGGVGKTAIAAETAKLLIRDYEDRILWISAEGREDFSFSTLLDDIAAQLGKSDLRKLDFEQKQNLLEEALSASPTLVVLDNFETIIPEEGRRCEDWFANARACSALVTTRQHLGRAHRNIPVDSMKTDEATVLLQRSIKEAHDRNAFAKVDGQRIVQVSEGNPLVLQWIVGQIDLAQDAEEVLEDLRHGAGTAAERVFDRSFRLKQLDKGGRPVLLALSLFVPSAGRKALAAVAGFSENNKKKYREAVKTLSSLWLLRTATGGERLALDALTREFTRSRLLRDPRHKIFVARYIKLYLRFLQINSQTTAGAFNTIESEKDNISNAIDAAFQTSQTSIALTMCERVDDFLFLRGHWDQAELIARQALNAATTLRSEKQIVTFTHAIGRIYEQRGQLDEAHEFFDQALRVARTVAPNRLADLLGHLTSIAQAKGDLSEARRINTESLQMARASNEKWGIAASLHQLGLLSLKEKAWQEAREYLNQSLTLFREIKDKPSIAECLESLGDLELDQGSLVEAKSYFGEALQLAETLGNKFRIASVKRSLGLIARKQLNRPEALQLLYQSLALFAELKSPQVVEVRNDLKGISDKWSVR